MKRRAGRYDPDPALIRSALQEIVESQIRDGKPPETKETFDRLVAKGIPEPEVWKLLSCVVLNELNEMIKEGRVLIEKLSRKR